MQVVDDEARTMEHRRGRGMPGRKKSSAHVGGQDAVHDWQGQNRLWPARSEDGKAAKRQLIDQDDCMGKSWSKSMASFFDLKAHAGKVAKHCGSVDVLRKHVGWVIAAQHLLEFEGGGVDLVLHP